MSGEKESQPYTAPWSYLLPNFPVAMDCVPSNCVTTYILFPWCCFSQIFRLHEKNNTNKGHKLMSSQAGRRCLGGTKAMYRLWPQPLETLERSCLWGLLHCSRRTSGLTSKLRHLCSSFHAVVWDLVAANHLGNWLQYSSFPERQVKMQGEGRGKWKNRRKALENLPPDTQGVVQ